MIIPPSFPPKRRGLANATLPSTTTFKECVQPNSPSFGEGWKEGILSPSFGGGWGEVKKYPVRDYLSVETRWKQGWRHSVGMPPLSDASLRDAIVGRRSFSTERYIPTECSPMTGNHLRRRQTKITPCKRSAARGLKEKTNNFI